MALEVAVLLGDPRLRNSPEKRFSSADLFAVEKMHSALSSLAGFGFQYINEHRDLDKALRSSSPSFVLNLSDRGFRNSPRMEAHIPALLDMLGIPYTGSSPICISTCSDKALVRSVAQTLGIPVPREVYLPAKRPFNERDIPLPALIKPSCSDRSSDIVDKSMAASADEALLAITRLRNTIPEQPLLVQEFLAGREYSIGIVGNSASGLDVLPILEVEHPGLAKRSSYTAYARTSCYCKANLSAEIRQRLGEYAAILFERLGCRDYARVDFRADHLGQIKLLSVKPNPSWRWDGKVAAMSGFRGLQYPDLFRMILDTALGRTRHVEARRKSSVAEAV